MMRWAEEHPQCRWVSSSELDLSKPLGWPKCYQYLIFASIPAGRRNILVSLANFMAGST